jgi:hypothetical protein
MQNRGLSVLLQSVSITNTSVATSNVSVVYSEALPVLLDTGGPSSSGLPNATYLAVTQYLAGLGYSIDSNNRVDCALREATGTIDLTFADTNSSVSTAEITIAVPLSQLALPLAWGDDGIPNTCLLGFNPVDEQDGLIFGDTFIRSMYMVFNMDNHTISLAQSKANGTNVSNIEYISTTTPPSS